ncbi:zinc-binding dehydrogenase, partial [Lacisediminihabitans sp.]
EAGDVPHTVDSVFDLTAAADAHTAIESGHTRGKIVLDLGGRG